MNYFRRDDLPIEVLPGRAIQKAIGKGAYSTSDKITMGFACYSAESGPMVPHTHAEEVVYILSADRGWFRYGPAADRLSDPVPLEAGMVLHNPPLEWHVFGYADGGHVEIIFVYGQVDQIRPEEMTDR
jgi:hypothetical protein